MAGVTTFQQDAARTGRGTRSLAMGHMGKTGHDIKTIQIKDADLGSCSVLVLPEIGGRHLVITSSKHGDAYLLDAWKQPPLQFLTWMGHHPWPMCHHRSRYRRAG